MTVWINEYIFNVPNIPMAENWWESTFARELLVAVVVVVTPPLILPTNPKIRGFQDRSRGCCTGLSTSYDKTFQNVKVFVTDLGTKTLKSRLGDSFGKELSFGYIRGQEFY